MKTMTSRAFNQNIAAAKRAARDGPVIVTDRGVPGHVLLAYEEYTRIAARGKSLAEALSHPPSVDIDLDLPSRQAGTGRGEDAGE